MAQFTFKLRAVLSQREMIEQGRQRELAVVEADRVAVQLELKRLDDTVRAAVADLRENQLTGKLNLSFLAAHRRFILATQRQGVLLLQKLDAAQQKVDAARAELAEAAKQRRIIEKLRERQQAAWTEAINKKETAALDEIAMQMTSENMRQEWSDNVGKADSDNVVWDQPENRL
jgi:flagellar FliJ protein